MTEKTIKKDIHETKEVKEKKSGIADLPKELRFTKGLKAHLSKDAQGMAEYNSYVASAWAEVNKANYQNVTTAADGGSLVPDPEFSAEIERLTDEYGVAARLATVRRTDRDSVTMLSGTNEISFTLTGEAEAQNAQKLTYTHATVAINKYLATLVMTSEIVEDSAIDIFADAANEIARARAKLFDQLVFTDSTYGLLSAEAGDTYKTQTVGTAYTDFDADDAMDATYKVVSSARRNGRFFFHPTVWNELRQTKEATTGGYLFGSPSQSVTPMIDGYPVELVDVLPSTGDITANEAFGVFGDLSRIQLHVKRLLETKVFDSGVVKDAAGSDINLITQDSWAMRATLRVVPQTRFQGAFTIIGTGWVS
jgi:HK97 family phage major capsid protein